MNRTLHNTLAFALVLFGFPAFAATGDEQKQCVDLECLICPAVKDDDQYQGRGMKLMRYIAPGDDRWLFRSTVDLSNTFGIPEAMRPEFARLMSTFANKGTHVMIAVQPTRGLMHRDKVRPESAYGFEYQRARASMSRFIQQLRDGGALVPDIMSLVDNPPQSDYFFRRDSHWTPSGAQATARVTAEAIKRQAFYKDMNKKAYRTEPGVTIYKNGILDMALNRLCKNDFGPQFLQGYRSVPQVDDETALFDDEPVPEVIMVGTSNSAARDEEIRHYNFDGYLKEYTSLDILNYAMQGAGQDGALLEYLLSDEYSPDAPPKLIVWELPVSYQLDSPVMYRQLIPAINGGCAKGSVLASNRLERKSFAANERIELLSNAGEQRQELVDLNGFLELRFSDKNIRDFYLIVYYDNGSRDKVRIRRQAVVSGGTYHLELSKAAEFKNANLLSVFMEPSQPLETPTQIDVQLCQ